MFSTIGKILILLEGNDGDTGDTTIGGILSLL
jgi:hypothetical protein